MGQKNFWRKTPFFGAYEKNMMKTDIKEKDNSYEIDIDLPGFQKEEISANLENGYLTINDIKKENKKRKRMKMEYTFVENVIQDNVQEAFM